MAREWVATENSRTIHEHLLFPEWINRSFPCYIISWHAQASISTFNTGEASATTYSIVMQGQ